MTDTVNIAQVPGDGADGLRKGADLVNEFRGMMDDIRRDAADSVVANRQDYENTLFCKWDGQSSDGRKWQDNYKYEVKPFDGASDNRVRLADMLVSERVRLMTAAAMRAEPKFTPMEGADAQAAAKWSILANWLKSNYWGNQFRNTLKLLARWQESDTPAVCAALVDWTRERRLEYRTVTPLSLVDLYVELAMEKGMEPSDEHAAMIVQMARDPMMAEPLVEFLKTLNPGISEKRAKRVAKDLQEKGEAEFPAPYLVKDGPEVRPLRMFEDVFIPANTTDPEKTRVVFLREWLTETGVREKAATQGWNGDFLAKLLGDDQETQGRQLRGFEGRSGFEEDGWEKRVVQFAGEAMDRKGYWEIVTALHWATNEDGVPGLYTTTFSKFVDEPALAMQPFKRKHGGYPIVWFKREQLTQRFMDSRGVPEMAATDQASLKLLKDSREDHTQVSTLPPIKKPVGKPHYVIEYQPMGTIESNAREPTEFMRPPEYPASADKYWEFIRRDLAEFWGRAHPEIPELLTQVAQQDLVDDWLAQVGRIFVMAIQLCQELMPDEMISRIVGGNGLPIARSRKEIQGRFDLKVQYDVRDLDGEKLKTKVEMVLNYVKALDVRSRVRYDDIAVKALQAIDPSWADSSVQDADVADNREAEEEKAALVMLLNGTRAPMPEGGINAQLRLQVLQGELQARQVNEAAYPPISAASAALIKERMDYLEFQGKQVENAVTGRIGVDTAKTDEEISNLKSQTTPTTGMGEMMG